MEDGVVFRHSANEFLLTAARPNLSWFGDLAGRMRVDLEDVSDEYGVLAVQGPRSRAVLSSLAPETEALRFFEHVPAKIASAPVTLSRTGYTGDLGFEVTVTADQALDVLDAVLEAGRPHSLRPFGEEALMVLRIEAGLPLIDVDWHNSRLAFIDADRVTPTELGMGWMLPKRSAAGSDDRAFVGRDAIRRELAEGTSRWATVGLVVDHADWDRLHRDAGLLPDRWEHPTPYESMLYDAPAADGGSAGLGLGGDTGGEAPRSVGFVTSFVYSPVLQRHIGLARVRPDLAAPGSKVHLEVAIAHHNTTVLAHTAKLPLFNPARKTA
jgi:aminomethyltransferase